MRFSIGMPRIVLTASPSHSSSHASFFSIPSVSPMHDRNPTFANALLQTNTTSLFARVTAT